MTKKNGELLRDGESKEQILLVQWFRRTYPDLRIFAIPNGGGRSRSQGARLKAEGVSPGVPDLFIPALALWIEMKSGSGRLSAAQKDWHDHLRECGYSVVTCWSKDEAIEKIEDSIVGSKALRGAVIGPKAIFEL